MLGIFWYAEKVNQDISSWNVANMTGMNCMFNKVTTFNQDILS